jgi:Malectin domain
VHTIRLLTIVLLSTGILWGVTGTLALSPGSVSGSSASLNLTLASGDSQPAGIQWTLSYPSGSILSVNASSAAAGKSISCAAAPGTYTCLLVGQNSSLIANGVVAALNVTMAAGTPSAAIGLTNTQGATFDGLLLTFTGTGTTITPPPPTGPFTAIRVDAGGAAFTDPATGNVWSGDTGFSGGSTFSTFSTITDTTNPSQAPLYQSHRFGNFQYQFAVPSGSYTVNLKFAEEYWTGTGQRVFNVAINGQTVLSNFDIVAAAGGVLTAVDRSFTTTATSTITIQFTALLDSSCINAIEILPVSAPVTVSVSPPTASLSASQQQTFTATATNTSVIWALSPANGAGTISISGNTATYTAPSSITAAQIVTLTATGVADPTKSASTQISLLPGATGGAIRVSCGGGTFTDPATGIVWSADAGFTGGSTFTTFNRVTDTASPSQAPLYQSHRFGNFQYQFTVPSGTYTVNLKFAEIYWTSTGQRIFNVAINGQPVLSNFDIVAAAGGASIAVDRAFTVGPASTITIQFSALVDNASINAIEILPGTAPAAVSIAPATVKLTPLQTQSFTATSATNSVVTWALSPANGAGTISISGNTATYTAPSSIATTQTVTLTATSVADTTKNASAQITLSPGVGSTAIRVRAGGSAFTDTSTGFVWSADTGFTDGEIFWSLSPVTVPANPSQAPLYETERFGNFSYTFPVVNGTYTVTLKFAELYWTTAGRRLFNVAINGQTVLSNFDIFAAAGGPLIGVDRSFTVGPTSSITIEFSTVLDTAKVDAIQIQ